MEQTRVKRAIWSMAFAVGAVALVTLTESYVTVRDEHTSPPRDALAAADLRPLTASVQLPERPDASPIPGRGGTE